MEVLSPYEVEGNEEEEAKDDLPRFKRRQPRKQSNYFTSLTRSLVAFTAPKGDGKEKETAEDIRGSFGLNLLYGPPDPIVDLVFVHGLRGGSRKTWSINTDRASFWPDVWLRRDQEFKHVRIHSFGYDSDWVETKTSVLGIHDFGQSLLGALHGSQLIRRSHDLPIVLVGHSMGGLVIKKAYLLTQLDPKFQDFGKRFHTMLFLATPHHGAGSAQLLSNLLRAFTFGSHPFVRDLQEDSPALQVINDEFRHVAHKLYLYSFYETKPTNMGVSNKLIVEKSSAVMGYTNEKNALLNSDHRGACKFHSPEDPDFRTVRDAFVETIDVIKENWMLSKRTQMKSEKHRLKEFLDISDQLEDGYIDFNEVRVEGSCEWLPQHESFRTWRNTHAPKVFWLNGGPGVGKSFLAAYVVEYFKRMNDECSFFFFKAGDNTKSAASNCLLSLAYQMGLSNASIRETFLTMVSDEVKFDKDDCRAIWRKLFDGVIFQADLQKPHFWILDALDECKNSTEILPLLLRIEPAYPIYIFVTSRPSLELQSRSQESKSLIFSQRIPPENTISDIELYIKTEIEFLAREEPEKRQILVSKIMAKSEACFLWVSLILKELRRVYSASETQKILEDVLLGMNELYTRILKNMSAASYGKPVAKSILMWTACAIRPLSTTETEYALQLDIGDTVRDLENQCTNLCSDLVFVDTQNKMHMVHQTARTFLFEISDLEFAFTERSGHQKLALACLRYLTSDEMKPPRGRRPSAAPRNVIRSPFIKYAAKSFFEHINKADPTSEEILSLQYVFFTSPNVLSWLEFIASDGDLRPLVRTGTMLRNFLSRRAKQVAPLGKEVQALESWSLDLARIVAKFGRNLLKSPSSIYHIIPPFCPRISSLFGQFGESARGIKVIGVTTDTWDDCQACIAHKKSNPSTAASTANIFVTGASDGLVRMYNDATCQQIGKFDHGKPLKLLQFSATGKLLASVAQRSISMWEVSSLNELWNHALSEQCIAVTFNLYGNFLIAACKDNKLHFFDAASGERVKQQQWYKDFNHSKTIDQSPVTAAFCQDLSLLAFVYRGGHIHLWNWEENEYLGTCEKASTRGQALPFHASSLAFNPCPGSSLLAAAYEAGEIILFDPLEGLVKNTYSTDTDNQVLAASPDGRTLISGDSSGTIRIFDFETLKLIYLIRGLENPVKSLTFCSGNLRFVDIRRSQTNVWEPAVLLRLDGGEEKSAQSEEIQEVPQSKMIDTDRITVIATQTLTDHVICGTQGGIVKIVNSSDGSHRILYKHHAAITKMTLDEKSKTIASADSSSRILVHKLHLHDGHWVVDSVLLDRRMGSEDAIEYLLLSPDSTKLLISCDLNDMMCTIGTEETVHVPWDGTGAWTWIQHPLDARWFVLVAHDHVRTFAWADFKEVTTRPGVRLEMDVPPKFVIKTCYTFCNGRFLATAYSERHRRRTQTQLYLWRTADLDSSNTAVYPDAVLQQSGDRLGNLIGTFGAMIGSMGDTILFLDHDGWVCSFDIDVELVPLHYRRHFFLPFDWLSTDKELIFDTSGDSDIIFAKSDELVVIKRGLECVEKVPFAPGSD